MYFHVTCDFSRLPAAAQQAGSKVCKAADKRNIKEGLAPGKGSVVHSAGDMLRFLVFTTLVLYGKWVIWPEFQKEEDLSRRVKSYP